jgi:hypothetical protein
MREIILKNLPGLIGKISIDFFKRDSAKIGSLKNFERRTGSLGRNLCC